MSFILIESLNHTYLPKGYNSVPALKDINLSIDSGEYVAVVGANGSGKTTLALHLNGILLPSSGRILINGRDPTVPEELKAIRMGVGMVFQSPEDQIVATVVEEDVAFGPENLGMPEDELPSLVREALKKVCMWEERERSPHLLSTGQQQRVAIAGALAAKPHCLVLDEATAMLDPAGRQDILGILDELNREGMTIITVTHRMEEAVRTQRIIVLQDGRIVRDAAPEEIFSSTELSSWGLLLPPAAELSLRLSRYLPALPQGILTTDELADALMRTVT